MNFPTTYRAYLVTKDANQNATAAVTERPFEALPPGDVIIKVAYSSLNYKDALSATGHTGVTKNYPHVPGIDAAGTVIYSKSDQYKPGDKVLVTGYDLGSNTDGGFAEYIRVPAEWVVPLPSNLTLKESMIYGTAGFTAAICVSQLQKMGLSPDQGEVVVSGASGGVGCLAVALLAKEGYQVVASTGKPQAHDLLKRLGAARIIGREELNDQSGRPLLKGIWAGAVDTVGGNTLSTIIRSLKVQGSVAACGNVADFKLDLTVYPFILRGVNLLGADSALWPRNPRVQLWQKLANEWKIDLLESLSHTITLNDLSDYVPIILKGGIVGRTLIQI
ncbi:MAG: YhdH/YhfP family quinone oxidoreductase [candidate division KSB1 bacterium]|nr:YhdH/YhfP family quinone oxidoreductase [candidate division KSB1 bacterium]MDZ7334737.1 YhdH/YhfP family quinone oxidoreductase [candidate division KSB1 bacterium]MDZ7358245.1 YhdH/YhfP family quinone oxidoreductase [candidate division KSB1 bacterium]MDZ7376792.1 YhdH/YhfP family quinone oxidoreductase [candidate division KSB1 bacterium]MDZ7400384.1 YhdH/YhfP family quinone oxidoreductase [candidate division KSB1 bacterium]